MPKLCGVIVGKPVDFRPIHYPSRKELVGVVSRQLPQGVRRVLFTRIDGSTTNIAGPEDFISPTTVSWFAETKNPVDGAFITGRGSAIFIANADCPIFAVRSGEQLLVLHCAFRCLIGSSGESIILRALHDYFPDPAVIDQILLGFGAGPCCFGQESSLSDPDIRRNVPTDVIRQATRGPRMGSPSVDLFRLAMMHLEQAFAGTGGFQNELLTNTVCTACAGRESGGPGKFWSHVWDGKPVPGQCEKTAGRNGVFIWIA